MYTKEQKYTNSSVELFTDATCQFEGSLDGVKITMLVQTPNGHGRFHELLMSPEQLIDMIDGGNKFLDGLKAEMASYAAERERQVKKIASWGNSKDDRR
jgi:hypothetical protein